MAAFATLSRDAYGVPFPVLFAVRDSASGAVRNVQGQFLGP